MIQLSATWGPVLRRQPETGIGYQIARVELCDGRRFDHVVIIGGLIVEVKGYKDIPFDEADIKDIVVNWFR